MGGPLGTWWVILVVFLTTLLHWSDGFPEGTPHVKEPRSDAAAEEEKPKLLYILLDGFRWDYVDKQKPKDLPGFNRFLKEGVKARWTVPIFPAVSYPSWTTLVTGLYAENHGIVGNYFYDSEEKDVFSLADSQTTGKPKWWTSEPIWTTAEKAGMKTAQYIWARCDVPFDNLVTHHCEPYTEDLKKDNFLRNTMKALQKFDEGFDFVQVYSVHVDETGHEYGPDSDEVKQNVREMDSVIDILLDELEDRHLDEKVNIVIVSDHGMADTSPEAIQVHDIDNYLDMSLVENIADKGALMSIKVNGDITKVYQQLLPITGATVFKRDDIPDNYHYKKGKYVPEILLRADAGNYLRGSSSVKQLPKISSNIPKGSHGYSPDIHTMRGIFFAKGPAFQQNHEIDPISLVDVYQVLTNVMELVPMPHNGTWSKVEYAFNPSHRHQKQANTAAPTSVASVVLSLCTLVLVRYI